MIRGIVFDCYGVLVRGSLDYLRSIARDSSTLRSFNDLTHASDRGYVTTEEYVQQAALLLGRTEEDIRHSIDAIEVKNDAVVRLAASLRPEYKVGLLSNVGAGWIERFFSDEELVATFDAVALSGEIGMAKPYKEAFEYIAARLGLPLEECVMIDDGIGNVEGAKTAGMRGILFENEHQLRIDLEALLEQENA